MRTAIVSDIHGNRTAFEAVLTDLRAVSPDLILHGGDLADGGASSAEIVDQVRDLGWRGVAGNADEMIWNPTALENFAAQAPAVFGPVFDAVTEIANVTRQAIGQERIDWLRTLPGEHRKDSLALVHAGPRDLWRAPAPEASDEELVTTYAPLNAPVVVYGHIHRAFVRRVNGMLVINTGSVSYSQDGDPRASYAVIDDGVPEIRRVEWEVEKEIQALHEKRIPHADWIAAMLRSASFQMP